MNMILLIACIGMITGFFILLSLSPMEFTDSVFKNILNKPRSIKEEINAAQLKLKNDSINYYRQKNLWDQKIGSKIDFDSRKLNYDLARNNVLTLKSKLNRTKNELFITVKQAKNNYTTALVNTKDYTIKSSIAVIQLYGTRYLCWRSRTGYLKYLRRFMRRK